METKAIFYKENKNQDNWSVLKGTTEVADINPNEPNLFNHFQVNTIDVLINLLTDGKGGNQGLSCTERFDGSEYISDIETGEILFDTADHE